MANLRMTLLDLLNKEEQGADPNFLRDGVRLLAQELMEAEVSELTGADLHERSQSRLAYRNGYREREWDPGWHHRPPDPQAAGRLLLPQLAGAAAPARAGAALGGSGGLHQQR